jgi:hypothetical protein
MADSPQKRWRMPIVTAVWLAVDDGDSVLIAATFAPSDPN